MSDPAVSIVMCTYNGERFLEEQLSSIRGQAFEDYELIIVDDCSSDRTWAILETFAASDVRIRIYRNPENLGYNRNFQKAMALARGKYLSIADQDDIWLPAKTGKLVKAFHDESVVLAHGMSVRLEGTVLNLKKRRLQYHYSGNDVRRLLLFNPIMGHDLMFRARLLPFILPIPDRMSYDWWIAVVAVTHGMVASVPEVLVHHRIHDRNSFFVKTSDTRRKELDLDKTWEQFLSIPTISRPDKEFLERSLRLIRPQLNPGAGFNPGLFWHLFSHREVFFGHKRRKFPFISHVKNAIKYSKMNFNGKGII